MKALSSLKLAHVAAKAADEKQGKDILALDVRKLTAVTEYFLFVSGTSHVHVRALEDEIRKQAGDAGGTLRRTDGQRGYPWRVLDYGDVIVHIMDQPTREFYSIERLWNQGKRLDLIKPKKKAPRKRVLA